MALTAIITLTTAGADTGPFNLYSNIDGYSVPFETSVSKIDLESGYTSYLVPDGTAIIRVQSIGALCSNYIDLVLVREPIEWTVQASDEPYPDVCSGAVLTVYTVIGSAFTTGTIVYTDEALTIPLTGYSYIFDVFSPFVYEIDSVTGIIGDNTGDICVT